ncbi:MAG: hypothetical protein IJM59_07025 [Proteobacteria bacterium]|nr:hypothetical protein [Pseudomonadota bacterium]
MNRLHNAIIFLLWGTCMTAMSGCEFEAVIDKGEDCPPRKILNSLSEDDEKPYLSYIFQTSCSDKTCENGKYSKNFQYQYCPMEYSLCKQNRDDSNYHCEKDTTYLCIGNQIKCRPKTDGAENEEDTSNENEDEFVCIDPSDKSTCGAYDCSARNYGGDDCSRYDGFWECMPDGDVYKCQEQTNVLGCDDVFINPADPKSCGANSCIKDNYGGDDCTAYDDNKKFKHVCSPVDSTYRSYRCLCPPNTYESGGRCYQIDENSYHCEEGFTNCGTAERPNCADLKVSRNHCGDCDISCDSTNEICKDGKCVDKGKCDEGFVNCGTKEDPNCLDTQNDSHNCGECNHECSEGTYCDNGQCVCEDGLTNCGDSSTPVCIDLQTNDSYCGSCDVFCPMGMTCKAGECICPEGLEKCESSSGTACFDLKITQEHCGSCKNACSSGEACLEGSCKTTSCKDTECTVHVDESSVNCINDDTQCGPDCTNCNQIHANASCLNGQCIISECNANEHPLFNDSKRITQCEPNSVHRCAPTTSRSNDQILDCDQQKPANATVMKCSADGICTIQSCATGFLPQGDVCKQIQCGADTYLSGNECIPYVTSCSSGQHISQDRKSCENNTNSACGPSSGWKGTGSYGDYAKKCSGITPVCDKTAGQCICSDSAKVPNFNGSACVMRNCMNVPGVTGETCTTKTKYCAPKHCTSKYNADGKCTSTETWGICRPLTSAFGSYKDIPGWADGYKSGGQWWAKSCKSGYQLFHASCIPINNCCSASCNNCQAYGQKCVSGTCK